jgi:hypothetical protein
VQFQLVVRLTGCPIFNTETYVLLFVFCRRVLDVVVILPISAAVL